MIRPGPEKHGVWPNLSLDNALLILEYKKAVEAYEAAFGERPPYCVKDPEYIMKCVRRGEPSDHVPDPNACY